MTRYRIAALIFIAAVLPAQAQFFPGMPEMPGGKPVIVMPGGGWSGIDCKQMQEMLSKGVGAGMGSAMGMMSPEVLLKMMGCAPAAATSPAAPAAAPQSVQRPAAAEPSAQGSSFCEMFADATAHPRPEMWLGPHLVMGARDLEGCRLAPLNQQLVDGLRYFGEGRLQQSEAAFLAVAQQTPDAALRLRALAELAKAQLAARRTAEARATIEQALSLTGATAAARRAPGLFAGTDERMRHAMEQAGRDDVERNRTQMRAELMILMGLALQQDNDLTGAIARFREANRLVRNPFDESDKLPIYDTNANLASLYLAAALLRAGQLAEAHTLLQNMVKGREQTLEMTNATQNMGAIANNPRLPMPITLPEMGAKMEAFATSIGDIMLTPFVCAALAGLEIQALSVERALEATEQCRGRTLAGVLANRAFHAPVRALAFPSAQEMQAEMRAGTFEKRQAERERVQQEAILNPNPRARAAARPATIDEMRRMAAERNATLVVYAIDYESAAIPARMPDREIGIRAWVVSPDGRVNMRQRALDGLFPDGTLSLSAAALRLRESMGVPGRGAVRAAAAAVRPAPPGSGTDLKRFYQLLIEPIHDLLLTQVGARLIIVPERALFMVPYAALENASGEPLIARHALSVVPSLQTLALAALRKQPAGDAASSVVVGNPLMPAYTPRPGGRPMEIPPLPGAEEEANAIAAILKTNALTGVAATKSAVMSQIAGARYVHLATHGFLDRLTDQAQSGVNPHVREIALFDERDGPGGGVKTPGMLALAPSGGDSGMLSADEIAQSSTRAELVVMSACDSGRGAINDDGVIGLSRAWMAAGVPSVMVTLWTIPDDATKDLMVSFYQQLAAGTRKAEALRLAMLATRSKYPDPFNWAAFMLIGEPD